jgi:hypothetical protein
MTLLTCYVLLSVGMALGVWMGFQIAKAPLVDDEIASRR